MPFLDAKSLLFVPGDRGDRIPKALASAADAVIVDLEDAVALDAKDAARRAVGAFIDATPSARVLLRVNAVDSPWYAGDIALAACPGVIGVVLPKASSDAVACAAGDTDVPIWPLIETALGLQDLAALAADKAVARMLLGTIDLALDLGIDAAQPDGRAMLDMARYQVVTACAAAGLRPPVDGVFADLADETGLAAAAAHARACGLSGMMCIHPGQLATVNAGFAPSQAQTDWARRVLRAADGQNGAFRFEGQMIDKPVLERAVRLLAP
ncbi:CoA ester lyase [Thalassobius aquimarinus]|uniref:CoA ester lyase n=1 Tax=Thalassovita aquimarina TaxID=2785917 RepID=A0ABS5HRH6_9RHOB|nr:CoA ester lyase [Thalassovita aquimarina]